MKNFIRAAFVAAPVFALGLVTVAHTPTEKDIVDTAVAAGDFKTLASLVTQAGLVETLKSEGPWTVFAPTDKAFEKLPKEAVEAVVADKELLKTVLTYHVVKGEVMSKDAIKLARENTEVETVAELKIKLSLQDGKLFVNDSQVIKADVDAKNGVIHVIDAVLIPTPQTSAGARPAPKSGCGGCSGS